MYKPLFDIVTKKSSSFLYTIYNRNILSFLVEYKRGFISIPFRNTKERFLMKKAVAILLSALLLMSLFSVAAYAADEQLKVNAKSNFTDPVSATYKVSEGTFTLAFNLKTKYPVMNTQGYLKYDHNTVKLESLALNKVANPVINPDQIDMADFNSTSVTSLADFSKGADILTAKFKILTAGSTDIELYFEELNADNNGKDVALISGGKPVSTEYTAKLTFGTKASKKANPIKVKAVKKSVKASKLKKKAQKIKGALKVTGAKGAVTYTKVKKGSTAKLFKKASIAKKTGVITIKKGKLAKKTYNLKVKVKAAGNSSYNAKTVTKVVKIKVK